MSEKNQVKTEQKKSSSSSSGKSSSSTMGSSKSLMVVALRNKFFYMLYRHASLVFMASLISFGVSLSFLVFFAKKPVEPQYIPVNEDATFFKLDPLSECKPDAEVQKFTMNAIKKMLKYDYINYADQIQEAAQFFTIDGWNTYLDEFGKSGTLTTVKENQLISTVEVNKVPTVTRRFNELLNGVDTCMWDIETDVSMMLVGAKGQRNSATIYLRVVRNSVINNPEGLGIRTVVIRLK